jgi:hypothetical protein
MPNLPWWGWVIGVLALSIFAFRGAIKGFRRSVRMGYIEYLKETEPTIEVISESESSLIYRAEGIDQGAFFLRKLYLGVASLRPDTPEGRREVFEHFRATLGETTGVGGTLSLAEHGERVMPRLVPASFFNQTPKGVEMPKMPLGNTSLSVVYVLNNDQTVLYLTADHARELGLDGPALHGLALGNLEKTFSPEIVRSVAEGKSASAVKMMDSFDAARVLLVPNHLREGEAVAATIPDRDSLFLAPLPADGDWSGLKKLARTTSGSGYHLLNRPLKVSRDGFEIA